MFYIIPLEALWNTAWKKARVELRRLVRCELLGVKGWEGGSGWEETEEGHADMDSPCLQAPFVLEFGASGLMLPSEGQLPHQAS